MHNDGRIKPIIYVFGDSPTAHTGFGRVNKEIFLRLRDKYDLFFLGTNYHGDPFPESKLFHIFPANGDPFGKDRFATLFYHYRPDMLFTLNDYDALGWAVQELFEARQKLDMRIPWLFYFPVDGGPVHPEWSGFLKDFVTTPVTVTKYGQEELKKADPTLDVPYVYHGVNTMLYRPISEEKINAALKKRYENKFVVLMVGQNQLRKQYNIALEAFADFAADKKDVVLHLHCQPDQSWGWNIPHLANMINTRHEKEGKNPIVVGTSTGIAGYYGWSEDKLPILYNSADVFLHTSLGEGFGIPIIEAMACELPVIAHGVSSIPELVEDAGILTKTAFNYVFPTKDRHLIRPIPDKEDIVRALNELYDDKVKRQELGHKGRVRVVSDPRFNWEFAATQIDELIQKNLKDDRVLDLSDQDII